MAAKRLQEHPEILRRVAAAQDAIDALARRLDLPLPSKRNKPAKRSPFRGAPGKRFTKRQRQYLELLDRLTRKLGRPPSAQDMGEHSGISRLGARRLLTVLEQHGLAADVPKVVRSGQWALTEQGLAVLGETTSG